jgi:hypothetical protein
MKKLRTNLLAGGVLLLLMGLTACEKKETTREATKTPQVFTPATEGNAVRSDSALTPEGNLPGTTAEKANPKAGPAKLPTPAELKTITPSQEAKRALTNDAMKASEMSFQEFGDHMKSRIPYYRGKGDLKFENDIVRIRITKAEMQIETQRGSHTFPMQ